MEKARQKALEFGQQSEKMTKIAQEAREHADALDKSADNIVQMANEAKNKSIEAYDMAKNVTEKQKNISNEIDALETDLSSTEIKLSRIAEATEIAYYNATDINNRALALLNTVKNLVIPTVNPTELRIKAEEARLEAQKIADEAKQLLKDHDNNLRDIREDILNADDLLQTGTQQRDEIDGLAIDIETYQAQAMNAVELGNKTLTEAKATYEILKRKYNLQLRLMIK